MIFSPLICRWPNGDISIVAASSRVQADDLLDEVGNPDCAELLPLKHPIAIHFSLKKFAPCEGLSNALKFDDVNEELHDSICERVYPILSDMFGSEDATQEMIDAALEQERQPLDDKQPELSLNPGAAEVQLTIQMPRSVAEQ